MTLIYTPLFGAPAARHPDLQQGLRIHDVLLGDDALPKEEVRMIADDYRHRIWRPNPYH